MKDILSRHYTQQKFAQFLVSKLNVKTPNTALDLGVGQASLSFALKKRWKKINITAVDVDKKTLSKLPKNFFHETLNKNCLSFKSLKFFRLRDNQYEVAVCNPPYKSLNVSQFRANLLLQTGFSKTSMLKSITSDIYFLAKNLMVLKPDGVLGIIMPDTVISGKRFQPFRNDLINNFKILGCFQLPPSVFSKTEAQAHILIIQKSKPSISKLIPVSELDLNAKIKKTVYVSSEQLIYRMDFNYNGSSPNYLNSTNKNLKTIKELNFKITRGKINNSQIRNLTSVYFHSTSFKTYKTSSVKLKNSQIKLNIPKTKAGAILFSRVGSRCIGKFIKVRSGEQYFTDCIFQIEAPTPRLRNVFLKQLKSSEGQEWIKSNTKGVCAKSISICDLMNFPIPNSI